MTENPQPSLRGAVTRTMEEAEAHGGNAVLAMSFDPVALGGSWSETCAYGTAVVIEPIG